MSVACHDRSRRWQEIQNGLQFIQSTLPFPGSQEQYEVFIQDLVRNLFGEGNDVFQEGEWTKSIEMYTEALSIAEYAESEEIVIPIGLLEKLYANRAAAYLNMVPGLHDQALEDCEKALHYNEGNYRALYRKAKSLKELGRHQEAYESVAKCSLVVPQDPNVMQLTLDLAKLLGLKIRKAYVRNKPALNVLRGSSYSGTSCEKFSHGCTSVEEIETEMSPLSPEARAPTPVSAPPPASLYQPMNGNNNGRAEETLMTPWEEPSMSPVCNNHLPSSASHSSASHSSASHSPTEMMCGFEPAASPVPVASVMSSSVPGSMSSSSLPHHHGPSLVNGGTRASQPSYMLPESRQDYEVDIMGDDLDDLLDLAGPPEPSMAIPTVKGSIHLPTSIASGGSMPSSPFLMPSPINPFLHHVPQRQQCTVNLPPLYNKPGSGSSSGYSLGLEGLDSFAAPIDSLDSLSMNDSHHTDYGGGHHSFTISQMNNNDKPMGMAVGMPDTKGHASHVDLAKNPLAETHEFKQACSLCFIKTGPAVLDYTLRTEEHKCKKDWLLSRIKHVADKTWKLIRTRPTKNQYVGPYYVCKEVSIGQECVYPGHCTFAYCQEEIDVWTLERKGFISREALFDPFGSHCNLRMSVPKILQEHHGIFMFLCEVCFDHRPRIISKANKENPSLCSHPVTKHDFEDHKCLVHILKENTVRYSKVRPLNPLCQLDLCRHEVRYGCVREDDCFYAHSLIELKVWGMQHELGITHESIVQEARKYWCIETSLQGAQQYPPVQKKFGPPNLKLQFVCGQCWRNGQLSEADKNKKYCTAKARHTWSKDRRVVLVSSTERKKWTTVRQLPSKKPIPSQFEICMHVTAGKKCQYIGNCTFAHSGEEKDLWTYMKENNIPDLDQLYEHWLQSQKPGWGEETPPPPNNAVRENGRQIVMPTDYAEEVAGNHCWLCGKNSNGEKQWQQHITSEKHKDKVFNSEDDQNCWQYRFPTGTFRVCERFLQDTCTEEELCKLAHGNQELKEWIERREFLLMKLAKARKDHLIAPNDNDFGKYSFLLKDIN